MAPSRPNILLITADQLRADCLSAAGHPLVRTPRLDALAGSGVLFRNHFTQCVPCGPARTSLLTGMYAMNHRSVRNGTPLDARFTNLAKELRKGGYEPWLIGYTDTTLDPRAYHPADPSLRRYEEVLPGMLQFAPGSEGGSDDPDWRRHLRDLGYANADDPYRQAEDPESASRGPTFAPILVKAEHSDTAYTTDRALRFLRQELPEPWLLHGSYLRPHPPFVAPAPYHAMYRPDDVPDFVCLPSLEDERRLHPFHTFRLQHLEMDPPLRFERHPNDDPWWRRARATYYGLISELDGQIGRLLDGLDSLIGLDRTLVIVTSDHAEQLGDHFAWGKETHFDRSAHIPLIVRPPGGACGRVVHAFSEHGDLMPTILGAAGIEVPLQCDGRPLQPLIEGDPQADWRTAVHWEYDFGSVEEPGIERRFGLRLDQCGVAIHREARWKYIHFAGLPPLLFVLQVDPGELHDLAQAPAHGDTLATCAHHLLSWRMTFAERTLTGTSHRAGGPRQAERRRRVP
jgi:arylsulfatase A-like enzyme